MGLDMYLSKKTYVQNWEHTPETERHEVSVSKGGEALDTEVIDPEKVSYIVEDVGYWRKANAIHRWFVEHVQHGDDNCGTYDVSREQLQQLLDTVNQVLETAELVEGEVTNGYRFEDGQMRPMVEAGKVIKDPSRAMELLPTQEGFFFGSTDYDEWYYEDLVETKRILEGALSGLGDDFEYSSSW
jgi:hypothetical protein